MTADFQLAAAPRASSISSPKNSINDLIKQYFYERALSGAEALMKPYPPAKKRAQVVLGTPWRSTLFDRL